MHFTSVVLPLPLGPSNAKEVPSSTVNDIPFSTSFFFAMNLVTESRRSEQNRLSTSNRSIGFLFLQESIPMAVLIPCTYPLQLGTESKTCNLFWLTLPR